ncbi:hypothetical protein LX69_02746 [Breznakibacter xylanolyticus]|uniref:Lipoprotein n=1 Tax=Breznakibacter xylanolyticus TaxID=990 RepID=A0A2W7NNU8_9BACT|nr:hypothetical protein [Breznakibacter xylanolyticus]PZX12942.1 hypothetical protein LX69_02746 [Breznakibacter xylanolyticus]
MKQYLILITLAIVVATTGCHTSQKKAEARYAVADSLFCNHQYHTAKLELDSIIELYPEQIAVTTRAKDLLHKINISEQENNLRFLDSLMVVKRDSLAPLMQNFEITDDGSRKTLVHKQQKRINYYGRTYLRPTLDTLGNFYLTSYYCGEGNIHHTHIKVTAGDASMVSETIEPDGFYNRQFDDGGLYWEVVQYRDGKDNGVIDLIARNADKTIKVQLMGKRNTVVWMEKPDKEAIRDGYEISFLLKEIAQLQKEKENAYNELKRLGAKK